jgi:hypothetical protein
LSFNINSMKPSGKAVGLAIGQKSILIAEVQAKGAGQRAVQQTTEFVYPEGISLATPAELGKALGQFLRAQKIGTRDAIIGLPAKRLVTRKKDVPPAQAAMAASTLRLQAEGEFSSEHGGLVMDFAGLTSTTEPTSVLLVATARDCIDQCTALAAAAGLRLRAITATAAALARVTGGLVNGEGVIVSVAPGNSELVVQHGDAPSQLRHLNVSEVESPEALAILAGEIRRTVAALPRNGSPLTLAVWDRQGDGGRMSGRLQERLNLPVTSPDFASGIAGGANLKPFAPAIAVALAGTDASPLPLDFLHSRLAPPRERSNKRALGWAIAVAAAFVIAGIVAAMDLNQKESELADLQKRVNAMSDDVKTAQTAADRLRIARAWNSRNPRFVACLRDLTALFPDEGSVYATSLTLENDGSGRLTGKASTQQLALALKDKVMAAKGFTKPQLEMRDSDRSDRETTFVITFVYRGTE